MILTRVLFYVNAADILDRALGEMIELVICYLGYFTPRKQSQVCINYSEVVLLNYAVHSVCHKYHSMKNNHVTYLIS